METRIPPTRSLLPIAALALAVVVIVVFGWRSFGGPIPLGAAGYRIEVPLAEAFNMEAGADVTIAGVHVGDVTRLRRDGYQPVAEIELDPRYAPLHEGARAIPRTKSLLGEAYIEMTVGDTHAAPIPEHARLPATAAEPAQAIDDVLETFSPRARRSMRRLARGMALALEDRGGDLNDALGNAPLVFGSLADVMSQLDEQRGDVQQLIAASTDVFAAIGEREGSLRAAVRAGNGVLETTARNDRALRATVRAMPPFLDAVTKAAGEIDGAGTDLRAAVAALRPLTPKVRPALTALRGAAPLFKRTFAHLRPVLTASERGLPAVDRIAKAFGASSAPIHRGLREIIPVAQLARETRRSLMAFFSNVGNLLNGVTLDEKGELVHISSAMPSLWNETTGGWVKRLPTNRPNAFPKPNSALDIADGHLKTFDCRHTGNRAYLPATGGRGAPPCDEQGPWQFDGVTAYYPRLRKAKP